MLLSTVVNPFNPYLFALPFYKNFPSYLRGLTTCGPRPFQLLRMFSIKRGVPLPGTSVPSSDQPPCENTFPSFTSALYNARSGTWVSFSTATSSQNRKLLSFSRPSPHRLKSHRLGSLCISAKLPESCHHQHILCQMILSLSFPSQTHITCLRKNLFSLQ